MSSPTTIWQQYTTSKQLATNQAGPSEPSPVPLQQVDQKRPTSASLYLNPHVETADDELQIQAGSSTGNQHRIEAQKDLSSETLWRAAPAQSNTSEHG